MASTRSAPGSATRTGLTGTPNIWCVSRPVKNCRSDDYDVIVIGGARRALR